jgi:8-oxo-dGTP diphosphatase
MSALPIHVAAAVVVNSRDEVLISLRPDHVHQGGLWEFPGGKVEEGEDIRTALHRELHEELGIEVQKARPLIRIPHDYGDKAVLLDVWLVQQFSGQVHGREGQSWRWVCKQALCDYRFPAANMPIITAVNLPDCYLITPSPVDVGDAFLTKLEHCLQSGISLVQLRAKQLNATEYATMASEVLALCQRYRARLLLNAEPELVTAIGAHGIHLSSQRLLKCEKRPLPAEWLVGASCHNEQELEQAQCIGADFAVMGPVLPTASHPGARPLGWQRFASLTENATIPVFSLGGLGRQHLEQAFNHGAQGIAAISALWQGSPD